METEGYGRKVWDVGPLSKSIVKVMQTYANHPNNLENLKR